MANLVNSSWRRFLIDVAFAKNYQSYFAMTSMTVRGAPQNPVLDELLPSLLHIKVVSILDAALISKLDERGVKPKHFQKRNDLSGRIDTAVAAGLIADAQPLHEIRESRNNLAHEFNQRIGWSDLDRDVVAIHSALREMDFVEPLPSLQVNCERVPKAHLTDPLAEIGFDYRIFVARGDEVWAQITWSEELLPPSP